ncbi:MAG TPA: DUF3298 domain-containing protein, partial [Candidatus Ozemobacteraceae bacterium]|nr:DUF3298 domain-containing protein [Candidatus Ozemobacteraceae bacterium]
PPTKNPDVIPAEIEIQYPELSSSLKADTAVTGINSAIQTRLLALADGEPAKTIDELIERFAAGYAASVKETPEMPGAWSLKCVTTIRHADADLLALETITSIFTGGAHPNSEITYQVYSLKTGKPIELSALIAVDKIDELNRIAEKIFRQVRNLKPDETYEQAGFQFDKGRFALNNNFLVSKSGLTFCYNAYEIAPYALGTTELVIPWPDLKNVVAPKSLAERFLKE